MNLSWWRLTYPIAPRPPPDVCVPLLSRLLGSVSEPVPVGGRILQVSASLGVTFYPQGEEVDADKLLRAGRSGHVSGEAVPERTAAMSSTTRWTDWCGVSIEGLERIRLAMAREEFELVYQPRVNLHTGRVVGADRNGKLAMIELLLDFGADVEGLWRLEGNPLVTNGPPLFAAICCRQSAGIRNPMVRLLLKRGADVQREVDGRNAMDLAVHDTNAQLGDLLREHGAEYGPREAAAFNRLDDLKRMLQDNPQLVKLRYRPTYFGQPGQGPTLLGIALSPGLQRDGGVSGRRGGAARYRRGVRTDAPAHGGARWQSRIDSAARGPRA